MPDIKERLAKLAQLVRHDEEARSTCEDAIKRIKALEAAHGGTVQVNNSGGWQYATSMRPGNNGIGVPMPPGPKTQVKMDINAEHEAIISACMSLRAEIEDTYDKAEYENPATDIGATYLSLWETHSLSQKALLGV